MRVLLTGKTGQLGSALFNEANSLGYDIIAPCREEFDISNKEKFLELILENNPEIVINTAAMSDVYKCEIEPENAFKYNSIAVHSMAKICYEHYIKYITISTDSVFDGLKKEPYIETDYTHPLNVYGISKLSGEHLALLYPSSIIVRTCGLYGLNADRAKGGKGNFIDNIIIDSMHTDKIEVGNDQIVSPTFADDLSNAIIKLIKLIDHSNNFNKQYIYHLVNEGQCTWYEFAKKAVDILNIKCEIISVDRRGSFNKVKKPLFSALKNKIAFEQYNIQLPHWKDALKKYLRIKYNKDLLD